MEPFQYSISFIFVIISIVHCTDTNVNLTIVNKCCPTGQLLKTKVCLDPGLNHHPNFSTISVFHFEGEMTKIDKNFSDVFKVVPDKFGTDDEFQEVSVITKLLFGSNVYITEDGLLFLEMPNAYNRWTKITANDFCVDYYMTKRLEIKMGFWIRLKTEPLDTNDRFITTAMFISCCFLLIVLVVYMLLPELQNLCGLILMAYVASLLAALLTLGIIRTGDFTPNQCHSMTMITYFFFLASFCWMNVMSYDIWWTFRGYAKARPIHRRGKPFKYTMYSVYAWGLPLAMTLMLNWINDTDFTDDKPWFVTPNLSKGGCFIEGGEKLYYLYMPMLILIFANWLFYLMTAFNIWRLSQGTSVLDSAAAGTPAAHRNHRQRFLVYLKLSVVMGLNWVLEVVSFLVPNFRFWYISDLYNILIGLSIFLIFVCKRNVLRKLQKQYAYYTHKWYPSQSNRSRTTSSESSQETQTLQVCANPKGPAYVLNNF